MRQAVLLWTASVATAASLALPALAQERGLRAPADALGGLLDSARWQARFERDDTALSLRGRTALTPPALASTAQQTLRLFGDYQLDTLRLGQTGGLRLTGGVLINLRGSTGIADPTPTLPYAGIGYAFGASSGAGHGLQWGLSADLGLTANGLGVSLASRGGATGLNVDGGLRDLRLQPMIRLGMNLSF